MESSVAQPDNPDFFKEVQRFTKSKRVQSLTRVAKKHGRPTSLTPAVAAKILEMVLDGMYPRQACRAVGITKRTLDNWKSRAKEWLENPEVQGPEDVPQNEQIFVSFFLMLEMAEAGSERGLLKRAARGEKGWQAAMTVMERRWPDRWGRSDTSRVEIGGGDKPVVIEHTVEPERQRRVARVLADADVIDGSGQEHSKRPALESGPDA